MLDDGEIDGEYKCGGVRECEREAGFGAQMAQSFRGTPKATEGGQCEDRSQREQQRKFTSLVKKGEMESSRFGEIRLGIGE